MSQYKDSQQYKANRPRVLERDNYVCVYDGAEATQVDHVIPRAKGGTDDMDNLVAACGKCNRDKSDKINVRRNWYNPSIYGKEVNE